MTKAEVEQVAGLPSRILGFNESEDGIQEVLEYRTSRDEVYALEFWNDYLTGYEYLYDDYNYQYIPPVGPPAYYPDYGRPIVVIPGRPDRPNRPNRPNKPSQPNRPSPSQPNRPGGGNNSNSGNTGRPSTTRPTTRPTEGSRPVGTPTESNRPSVSRENSSNSNTTNSNTETNTTNSRGRR